MVNKKNIQVTGILALILFSLAIQVAAAPFISGPFNNKTNNGSLNFNVNISDVVKFSINSSNETNNVRWNWFLNGLNQSNDKSDFTYQFTSDKTITVNLTNKSSGGTSNMITWTVSTQAPPLSPKLNAVPNITGQSVDSVTDTGASIIFYVNQSTSNSRILYGTVPSLSPGSWSEWKNNTPSPRKINLSNLIKNTTYYYSIYAYNESNISLDTNSSIQSFKTADPTAPNITSVTNGVATTNSMNITVSVDQIDSYIEIKYGETVLSGSKWVNTSGSPRTIQLTNLDAGKTYNYNAIAYNKSNQTFFSNYSTTLNFTTKFPGPTISNISPANTPQEITESETRTFTVTIGNQSGNFSLYENNNTPLISKPVNASDIVTYNFKRAKGTYKLTANVSNTNGSDRRDLTINVLSTSYRTGNRIWDGSNRNDFSLTYSWNPMSFSGFYYDVNDNVGNENINITLGSYSSRTIEEDNLVYRTSPQEVSFDHSGFGKYQVIGFMAEKYFAGYTANTSKAKTRPTTDFEDKSAVSQGQLHKVLIDEDTKRTISVGETFALKEGYVLKATDIDLRARTMLLSLLKDGTEVDVSPLSADETYVYSKTVGGVDTLPLIMVRFDSVFSGQERQVAFLKGLFQISEDATVIKQGNNFGNMEVREVSKDIIRMENSADISLNKGSTADIMGDVKIKVADNDSAVRFALSVEKTGNFEVRSTVYSDTNPVLEWTPYNFGMNIGDQSIGFYYDLDDGVGSETLTLNSTVSGSIPDDSLTYSTSPQEVKFTYTGFGRYQVIGFMADKYFAGYTSNTGKPSPSSTPIVTRPTTDFDDLSSLKNGALHKVLIDDDTKTTISVGSTISLKEGYVIKATDIDLRARTMLLSLLKDGTEVDISPLSAGETYVYTKDIGGTEDLPLIMVRFESVFSGQELQVAFLRGIFQISENPTTVKSGDQFGEMEVRSVSRDVITMSNDGDIGLDKNKNDALMGNLRLKVADSNTLRFYFAVDVTADMIENQLVIDAPTKIMAGDALKIKVTAGGKPVDNSSIALNTDIGTTDNNGELNYSVPRTLQPGTYNITAVKTGYEKATKNIEIEKYVDYKLSIEVPSKANQDETITIKVLYNGTAMSGASVLFDNTSIGTTDSNGEVKYKLETSGTHSITASKPSYISVSSDIDIRAPYSEFRALDINITPNPVFVNEDFVVRSNITNVGTKSDTLPVDLIINGTVVGNVPVTLGAGEKAQINFTRQETTAANITVEILGQTNLLVVQEKPTNYLLVAAIATGIGALIIYLLTSKGLLNLEILKQKFGAFRK